MTRPALSKNLHTASPWASTWGMLFNVQKSTHLEITSRKRPLNLNGNVTMGGMVVPRASTHKHLGVALNSSLTWQDHVNDGYTACARKVGFLQRLRQRLSSEALRRISLVTIWPKMEYACAVWSGGPTKKLVRLQDKFCREHRISLPPLERRFQF